MKRRETAEMFPRQTAHAAVWSASLAPGIALSGLAAIILTLLIGARAALAEPAEIPPAAILDVAMLFDVERLDRATLSPEGVAFSADGAADSDDAPATDHDGSDRVLTVAKAVDRSATEESPSSATLEELLFVRDLGAGLWQPQTPDEALAAAVALGTNSDLVPPNPFRKRNRDLFRTERPITIRNADMLLRLRLRAKARRAVSVELRF
jgi:hypothetical protein